MKSLIAILLFLIVPFLANAEAHIQLKINTGSKEGILYYTPSDGAFNFISRKEAVTNERGEIELIFNLKESGFVYIFPQIKYQADNWKGIQVYISPDSKINVSLDKTNPGASLAFAGSHAALNHFINNNERHFLLYLDNRDKANRLYVENDPTKTYQLVSSIRDKEIDQLKLIANISQSDFEIIQSDINQYYIHAFHSVLLRHGDIEEEGNWGIKEDWMKAIEVNKIIEHQDQYAKSSMWHQPCLDLKKAYLRQKNQSINEATLNELPKAQQEWALLNLVFNQEEVKAYLADKLFHQMYKNQFSESTLYLYQQFKERFPEYPYLEKLSKPYEKQISFLASEKKSLALSDNSYNSLKEICNDIDSEYIFIDIWATWCGPCIKEFSQTENLKKFVKKNPDKFTIVYITVDENKPIEEIEKIINFHNLEGTHILASRSLVEDIRLKFQRDGALLLPNYGVMDKKGQVIIKHASRPSQWPQLKEELENISSVEN